jgi:TonB-linked SusC/RagA family outer membrane protein
MRRLLSIVALILAIQAQAQRTVNGRVLDARDNAPLAGVTVSVKGGPGGTSTDGNGSFTLSANAGSTLVFSAVGFTPKEVAATGGPLLVLLETSQKTLQEVIVTGYTTQNKRQSSGSVARISGDELKMQPLGSFDKALQGKVAGLLSLSSSGQPGAASEVTIRGKGSINGSNTPLYIIDGVQVNAADFSSINPGDIESYNILKDASSTAIYGSRGANGVIVITTKRGRAGQTLVNYDFQYGWSELPKNRLQLMNSAEKLQYEFYDRPDGVNPIGWSQEEVDSLSKLNYDVKDILFRRGITQQHQVSASGGNEKTRFYLSGSIFDQEGIVITTNLKRYTGRFNIDNNFGNFRIGLNATLGYSRLVGTRENDEYIGSPLNAIRWFNPYLNLYDEQGNYQVDYIQDQPNPLQEILQNTGNADQLKGIGNAWIEFQVPWVKGLTAKTSWGGDFTQDESTSYFDRNTNQGSQAVGGNGQLDRAYGKTFRYTGTTSLSYQHSTGDHDFRLALYQEIIQSKSESFGFSGFGLVGPFRNEAGITPGSPTNGYIPTVTGNATQNGLLSYFADGTYGYKRKYFLNAGARRDGSSRLTADQRWANFYQGGLSWIISEEPFLNASRGWLSNLKYKLSYGSVGSQGIGDFAPYELLSSITYNGSGGLLLTNLQRSLTWEKKLMFNTGVEFSLWQGRLGGTIEVYNNTTVDLFLDRQLSRTSGFASITNNLGKLRNRGLEVSLNAQIMHTKDFVWTVDANYAYNQNRLLNQNGQDENASGLGINKVGYPINSIYVVRYAGVDAQTGEALYYTKDGKNTTNIYDPNDRVLIGPTDPPHFGGFSSNFNYKGLELDVLFSYAFGNYVFNNDRVQVENPIYWYSNLSRAMLREWQAPGDVTDVPSAFNDFEPSTTRFVEKANFLRLRNVMLSYSLPKTVLDRLKIHSLRVFAQGQNLYVWHNFQGYDPEVLGGILHGSQYPQLKTVTFGINVGF